MHMKTRLRPSWRALQLLTLASILLCIGVVYTATWGSEEGVLRFLPDAVKKIHRPTFPSLTDARKGISSSLGVGGESMVTTHPIEQLMATAKKRLGTMLASQATSLDDAAAKYRKQRKRHPPPGFNAWHSFASEKGVVIVEDFWDQIYDDLGPFWGVQPHQLREQTHGLRPRISIRNGVVNTNSLSGDARLGQWTAMLQALASHPHVDLPDVDIPLNINDEPAMIAPWDIIDATLSMTRPIMLPAVEVLSEYSSLADVDSQNSTYAIDPEWLGPRLTRPSNAKEGPRPFWSLVQPACPPLSPTRRSPFFADIWHPQGRTNPEHSAASMLPLDFPNNTLSGYISNWTIASDPCEFPSLQGLHGAFVAPLAMSVTRSLFPIFGASKMSITNEVLLPSPSDWNTSIDSTLSALPWPQKQNKLYWRGPATGGHNTAPNWRRFHRHRFVSMLNATQSEVAEGMLHAGNESTVGLAQSENFRLLPGNDYELETERNGRMAEWVAGRSDARFTDLMCDRDWGRGAEGGCDYNGEFYSVAPSASSERGEVQYKYTAVLDGDGGDSDTGFISHLSEGTVVLRASVYKQWYDSRLVPWLHFVPMDNTFVDLYGIMEFFLGTQTTATSVDYDHLKVEAPKHEHHFHNTDNEIEKMEAEAHASADEDGHVKLAEKMASAGKEWAAKALRREDMLVYVYRLVLEYARVLDDRRAGMGWVGDLLREDMEGK